jgi:PhnB protein
VTPPTPYIHFAGNTREALAFYAEVFGGRVEAHSFAEFGRDDGPPDAIAHGLLRDGPVDLYAADAPGQSPPAPAGLMMALLGAADSATLRRWFARLADGGTVVDDLARRSWGAWDGQVIDRFGVHWLIGFEEG